MNRPLSASLHSPRPFARRPDLPELAYAVASALMPYVVVTLLLIAFG